MPPQLNKVEILAEFDALKTEKPAWVDRATKIHKAFPSVAKLDWYKLFTEDPHVMGRIVGDILKIDQAPKGRVGKRASLGHESGAKLFRQLVGEDFTTDPFHEAFRVLVGERSLRGIANRVGVSHTHVRSLLNNKTPPSAEIMEKVATVFKKRPDYFLEWRVGYILGLLAGRLDSAPEASVTMYRKIKQEARNGR